MYIFERVNNLKSSIFENDSESRDVKRGRNIFMVYTVWARKKEKKTCKYLSNLDSVSYLALSCPCFCFVCLSWVWALFGFVFVLFLFLSDHFNSCLALWQFQVFTIKGFYDLQFPLCALYFLLVRGSEIRACPWTLKAFSKCELDLDAKEFLWMCKCYSSNSFVNDVRYFPSIICLDDYIYFPWDSK